MRACVGAANKYTCAAAVHIIVVKIYGHVFLNLTFDIFRYKHPKQGIHLFEKKNKMYKTHTHIYIYTITYAYNRNIYKH